MRPEIGTTAAFGALLALGLTLGCEARNLGEPPPGNDFFFPSGVLLDPLVSVEPSTAQCTGPDDLPPAELDLPGPRYLYVANGNNDRTYNAGTLQAIDLQAFWRAWYDPHRDDPAQAACLAARTRAQAPGASAADLAAACDACAPRDPMRGGVDPFCHTVSTADGDIERCVLSPGSNIIDSDVQPCRRLPLVEAVAECDERPFVADFVRVGDFATTLAASQERDGHLRLWLPVRGDPSITYVDVEHGADGVRLECSQGQSAEDDPEACGDAHRLDQLRDDDTLDSLDREPFNALVWEREPQLTDPDARGQRMVFVAHAGGPQLSVVDLDGLPGQSDPAIVDLSNTFTINGISQGGFGLAVRPCFEAGQGPLGTLDPESNVPRLTDGCSRPLVYGSMRFAGRLVSFTASGMGHASGRPRDEVPDDRVLLEDVQPAASRNGCTIQLHEDCNIEPPSEGSDPLAVQVSCTSELSTKARQCADPEAPEVAEAPCRFVDAGPYCATPEQIGQPCAIECEPQVRARRTFPPALVIPPTQFNGPILGDIAFADERGDQLLVLQTNPGALLSMDTSLVADGEPLDIPSSPPVEICAEPSRMKVYTEYDADGRPAQRYAVITCFRAALVYIVDLEALRVVDAIVVGTGPHDITIDDAREVAYVINTLESSVSVVDLSRRRPTRFQELARLGLQDPFSQ